jgi:hypothetical protein
VKANATAFLSHVEENATAFFGNGLDGHVALEAAVAAEAAEDVTGEAFAMDADEYGLVGLDVAEYESDVLCGIDGRLEGNDEGVTEGGREAGLRHAIYEALVFKAVGDDLRDTHDVESVCFSDDLQVGQASHGAVFVHDFADHAGFGEAGHAGEVNRGFGLPGADEDSTVLGAQGEHVARPGEVFGVGGRVNEREDSRCAIGNGDAGAAVGDVDGHGEGGFMAGGIATDHHVEPQGSETFGAHRHADEASAVGCHEVNGVGSGELGCHNEVAFVLAILVIYDDDDLAVLDVFDSLFNGR